MQVLRLHLSDKTEKQTHKKSYHKKLNEVMRTINFYGSNLHDPTRFKEVINSLAKRIHALVHIVIQFHPRHCLYVILTSFVIISCHVSSTGCTKSNL